MPSHRNRWLAEIAGSRKSPAGENQGGSESRSRGDHGERRNPILRLVLIAIPSFLAAILPGLLVAGAFAGVLWLFVYGDDPWPSIATFAVAAAFAASWTTFGMMLTRYLQRLPWTQRLSLAQLALVSLIASVAFVGALLLRQ